MSDSHRVSNGDVLSYLRSLANSTRQTGPAVHLLVVVTCQAVAAAIAVGLDLMGLPDAPVVIVFVMSVLVTALFTHGLAYRLAASIISILSYNFFHLQPRFSLQIDGVDYLATNMAMICFALLASYLVDALHHSYERSLEASLVAEREQLRANLLRSVSHDLRTPLTAITGNADMLLDEDADLSEASRHQLVSDIYHDATWLSNVVQNLLAVTRLEEGEAMLHTEVEIVDDVIEEAMRHISRDAALHHIVVDPSNDLLMARMDPHVIVQVIVNLVNNAIDHTPQGSTITISSYRLGGCVAVAVTDDGPGVSDQDKELIFEPFFKRSDGAADSGRNVGLGLSLCRSIIRAHEGEIHVEDAHPHGARFVFTLPCEETQDHVE